MLWVRVNNRWRKVMYTVKHPTGARYVLEAVHGEPDTVLVRDVESTPWQREPSPLLAS